MSNARRCAAAAVLLATLGLGLAACDGAGFEGQADYPYGYGAPYLDEPGYYDYDWPGFYARGWHHGFNRGGRFHGGGGGFRGGHGGHGAPVGHPGGHGKG